MPDSRTCKLGTAVLDAAERELRYTVPREWPRTGKSPGSIESPDTGDGRTQNHPMQRSTVFLGGPKDDKTEGHQQDGREGGWVSVTRPPPPSYFIRSSSQVSSPRRATS